MKFHGQDASSSFVTCRDDAAAARIRPMVVTMWNASANRNVRLPRTRTGNGVTIRVATCVLHPPRPQKIHPPLIPSSLFSSCCLQPARTIIPPTLAVVVLTEESYQARLTWSRLKLHPLARPQCTPLILLLLIQICSKIAPSGSNLHVMP